MQRNVHTEGDIAAAVSSVEDDSIAVVQLTGLSHSTMNILHVLVYIPFLFGRCKLYASHYHFPTYSPFFFLSLLLPFLCKDTV